MFNHEKSEMSEDIGFKINYNHKHGPIGFIIMKVESKSLDKLNSSYLFYGLILIQQLLGFSFPFYL